MFSLKKAFLSFVLLLAGSCAFAEDQPISKGMFGAGVNYPGVGVRYLLTDRFALEAKGQIDNHVTVAGLRAYQYFFPGKLVMPFLGVEGDYVGFSNQTTKGSGYGGEAFAGLEYFPSGRWSLQADFGPAYLSLRDKGIALTHSGLEFVLNFGLNVYFGGKAK